MPTNTKLSRLLRNAGMSGASAFGSASCGTFSSSTMIVMMTAITPSLNASSRPLVMRPPSDLKATGAAQLYRSASVLTAAEYVLDMLVVQAEQPRGDNLRKDVASGKPYPVVALTRGSRAPCGLDHHPRAELASGRPAASCRPARL